MAKLNIRPLNDKIVVKRVEAEERTKGGIVLPDTAKEKPKEGVVMAVGSGKLLENGERAKFQVKEKDRVIFSSYAGTEIRLDGQEYLILTEDGVTVAKEIELEDSYENMGAQMVKEVASKTSDAAGDGTTTATVLAEAIYDEGLKNVTAGANPIALQRGIQLGVKAVVEELRKLSKKIKDKKETAQVATI